jgi:RNA polymerase-binding transcription factor DksA
MRTDLEGLAGEARNANADDEHDPEGSTLAYERARIAAPLAEAESNLDNLEWGLDRLAEGTYSVCEGCGEEIATERLAALPATRVCFECASGATSSRQLGTRFGPVPEANCDR